MPWLLLIIRRTKNGKKGKILVSSSARRGFFFKRVVLNYWSRFVRVCRSEKNKISILHKTRPGRISGGNNGKVSGRIPSCISTGSRIFTCLRGNPPSLPDIVLGRECSRWQSSTNASCNVLGLSYTEIPIRARRRVARTPFVEKALTFRAIERLLSALFLLIVSLLINYLFSLFLSYILSLSLKRKEKIF